MICKLCGGVDVEWKGPIANLTHTECADCGNQDCQEIEPSEDCELKTATSGFIEPPVASSQLLMRLVCELIAMLESVEESDSGTIFHPTTIQTCRCMHAEKLNEIMPKIKMICASLE